MPSFQTDSPRTGPRPSGVPAARAALLGLLSCVVAACPLVDTHVPGPPDLDPLPAHTAHPTIVVSGAAEPGAKIRVRRQPEIPATAEPALGQASAASGRFSVVVPLEDGVLNQIDVVAIARNGLASTPATVEVTRGATRAAGIVLLLADARPAVGPGGATLEATARVTFVEPDAPAARPVTFRLTLPGGAAREVESLSDAEGLARLRVPGLLTEGGGTLTAEVREGNSRYEDTQSFAVVAGAAVSARVDLLPAAGGLPVTNVQAGAWLVARVEARDAGDNVVPVRWALSAEPSRGAELVGGALRFNLAGTYDIRATVPVGGGALVATTSVQVTGVAPGEGSVVIRAAVPTEATSGEPLAYTARLEDGNGRTLSAEFQLETDDPAVPPAAATGRVTLRRAGITRLSFTTQRGGDTLRSSDFFVAVRPGPAASLALTLDGAAAPLPAGSGAAALVVTPRQELLLDVTAQDAAGNAVDPLPLTLVVPERVWRVGATLVAPEEPGTYVVGAQLAGTSLRAVGAFTVPTQPPATLRVECPSSAVAGQEFLCTSSVVDARGEPVNASVAWSVIPSAAGTVTAGRARLTVAGNAQLVAAVSGTPLVIQKSVSVSPAAPATLAVALVNDPVQAGSDLRFTAAVADAFGNAVAAPLDVTTTAPDAIVAGTALTNLGRTGTYRLVARTLPPGGAGGLESSVSFTVAAAVPAALSLVLDRDQVLSGQAVRATAQLVDAYGNAAGTPSDIVLRVDGRVPDQLEVRLAGDRLTVLPAGLHVVSATRGDLSASALLTIAEAPDAVAPVLSLEPPALATGTALRPGALARVTVRAHDDRALSGVRLRATGPGPASAFDDSIGFAPGSGDGIATFDVPVPGDEVGTLTFTASVTDAAGLTTSTQATLPVDAHAGALTLAAGTAQTVSLDATLGSPRAVTTSAAGVWVRTQGGSNAPSSQHRLVLLSGGRVTERGRFTEFPSVGGLGVVGTAGVPAVFAKNRGSADDVVLLRWPAGAPGPQYATIPGLAEALDASEPTGFTVHATSGIGYAVEAGSGTSGEPRGRLFSAVVGATGSVDGLAVARFSTPDHALGPACIRPDVAIPTQLFVVGRRFAGASTFVGVYVIGGLTAAGHVQAGSTITTHVEEPLLDAGRTVTYGACAVVPGTTVRVAYSRWLDPGAPALGTLRTLPAACTGPCPAPVTLASGNATFPLASLDGLAWDGSGLVVAEGTAGRVFRLSGF